MKRNLLFLLFYVLLPLVAMADENKYFYFDKSNDGIKYKCCWLGPKKGIAYVESFENGYEEITIPTHIYAYQEDDYGRKYSERTYEVQLYSGYGFKPKQYQTIRKISLPSTIKRIPKYFCSGMINLEEFNCGDISFIGIGAFWNCVSLETFNIPNSVDSICSSAFRNCIKLKNINYTVYMSGAEYYGINVIPNSVKFLGEGVFYNCI